MSLQSKIRGTYRRFMFKYFRETMIDRDWMEWKGYKVDWDNPRDINEKIQWLMCRSDTSRWSVLSDKLRVRDFVREKGFGDLLVPILGVWEKAEAIDFDSLPDKFVLKCNHDSGSFKFVDKTQGFDPDALRAHFAKCLKRKYGYNLGELHYNSIPPRVLAEPMLESEASIVDYKVRCFGGKPYTITTCSDRTETTTCLDVFDTDWHAHPEYLVITHGFIDGQGRLPKPVNFDRMLEVSTVLSQGFPEVRVDFYEIDGKLLFGEMTFSSAGGRTAYLTDEHLKELGNLCVLPR